MQQAFLENDLRSFTLNEKLAAIENIIDELPIVVIVHNLETLIVEYMCRR